MIGFGFVSDAYSLCRFNIGHYAISEVYLMCTVFRETDVLLSSGRLLQLKKGKIKANPVNALRVPGGRGSQILRQSAN
jgi:hypothetical protein